MLGHVGEWFSKMNIDFLQSYHPLIIEGMGDYDPRDPKFVALQIIKGLEEHWVTRPPKMPVLLVTQGDPPAENGISAITRRVADELNVMRAMVFLDENIAYYHKPNADDYKVVYKVPYSQLTSILHAADNGIMVEINRHVNERLEKKNKARKALKMPRLAEYFYDFAMLQEVAKIGLKQICGALTVAHTSRDISPFSVTSFYEVGLDIGIIEATDIVPFAK